VLLKEASFAHQGCICLIRNAEKNCNIVKYDYSIHFNNVIYSCDGKAEFSAANSPVFSVA